MNPHDHVNPMQNANPFGQNNAPQYNGHGGGYRPVPPLQNGNKYNMNMPQQQQQQQHGGYYGQQYQPHHPPIQHNNQQENPPSNQPFPIQDDQMSHQQNAPWNQNGRYAESDDSPSDHDEENQEDNNESHLVRIESNAQLHPQYPPHSQHSQHSQHSHHSQQSQHSKYSKRSKSNPSHPAHSPEPQHGHQGNYGGNYGDHNNQNRSHSRNHSRNQSRNHSNQRHASPPPVPHSLPVHQSHRDVDLLQFPDIPAMPQTEDVNMKPEEQLLNRHVGFVLKLNAKLVQLNAECSMLYPQIAKDLMDSKLAEFQKADYKRLAEDKVSLTKKCADYESQIQTLLPVQDSNDKLQMEMQKMRKLLNTYSAKEQFEENDYREMLSSQSREYVTELQRQLDSYRKKVVYLSQQSQSCMAAIKHSVQHQQRTQEDINTAYEQLHSAKLHIEYLENSEDQQEQEQEQVRALQQEMEKLTTSHKRELEKLQIENGKLHHELDALQQQQENESEKIANKAQVEEHMEYKYKSQLQALQSELSKMTVQRITMEDEFQQRQKQEQERADRYRAKYESVKQHIKTLEMQKSEYTRVNLQLRQQNNQFRGMITSLQNELKGLALRNGGGGGGPHHLGGGGNHSGMNLGSPVQREISNQSDLADSPMRQQLMQLQQQQHMIGQQSQFNRNMNMNPNMNQMGNVMNNGMGNGMMNGMNNGMGNGMGNGMNNGIGNGMGNGLGNGMANGMANGMNLMMNGMNGHQQIPSDSYANGPNGADPNMMGNQGVPVARGNSQPPQRLDSRPQRVNSEEEELWEKKTKTISEKGSKKRLLVEWRFVTSDEQPHNVVLQHTQDTRLKTRRMLWVDGSEKYNNKSSASSFRIEIDKDVVVVSIDQLEEYQYRLTINNASFQEAHKQWLQKEQQMNQMQFR